LRMAFTLPYFPKLSDLTPSCIYLQILAVADSSVNN
jgi:hypothetical protein